MACIPLLVDAIFFNETIVGRKKNCKVQTHIKVCVKLTTSCTSETSDTHDCQIRTWAGHSGSMIGPLAGHSGITSQDFPRRKLLNLPLGSDGDWKVACCLVRFPFASSTSVNFSVLKFVRRPLETHGPRGWRGKGCVQGYRDCDSLSQRWAGLERRRRAGTAIGQACGSPYRV